MTIRPNPSIPPSTSPPAGPVVLTALRHLRRGGRLCCAGIHQSPIPEMDYRLLYGERTLTSATNSTRQDVVDLLAEAERIPIRTTTAQYSLEQANEALVDLKHSRFDGAAVLVM